MSFPPNSSNPQSDVVSNLEKIRSGLLFIIISLLLGVIAEITSFTPLAIIGLIIDILALIFIIIAIVRIRGGFTQLRKYGSNLGIGVTGATLLLIGYILILTIILTIVGVILAIVGEIMLGIGFYRLGKDYNNSTVSTGGIIMAIPFISFIGAIICYFGFGSLITNASTTPFPQQPNYPASPFPQQPGYPSPSMQQIYQVGIGSIDSNGYAYVTLNSQTYATVVSALLEGSNIPTTQIEPLSITPGTNNLRIYFGPQNFVEGQTYPIRITFNIAGMMQDILVSAVYRQQM
ncbi:DUF973 family protein [Acidianus manzaensis]|uniref:DUF973 domain-containing protein n=1 Tax=Acidianus manzaensis TaxID=282676 RepID=A0A1W6JWJ7_9CREN|nr:DUF973 family protein [Acidianus manzaensis]ARM74651.1 hypothetical protein B6F84_00495 [Acidianus manzaensis]